MLLFVAMVVPCLIMMTLMQKVGLVEKVGLMEKSRAELFQELPPNLLSGLISFYKEDLALGGYDQNAL